MGIKKFVRTYTTQVLAFLFTISFNSSSEAAPANTLQDLDTARVEAVKTCKETQPPQDGDPAKVEAANQAIIKLDGIMQADVKTLIGKGIDDQGSIAAAVGAPDDISAQKAAAGACTNATNAGSQLANGNSFASAGMATKYNEPRQTIANGGTAYQKCVDAIGKYQSVLLKHAYVEKAAGGALAQYLSNCNQIKQNLAQLEEAAKGGFSIDDALKIGQLAQMGMGALKTVSDMTQPQGGDPNLDPAGFGQDPFDFDPTGSGGDPFGPGGQFGPGGAGSQVPGVALDSDGTVSNGVQSAFVPDTNSNGVESASLGPSVGAGAAPSSATGSGFNFGSDTAGSSNGNALADAGAGATGGGIGGSDSSGASRLPGSVEEKGEKGGDATSFGGGGGGGGGSGGFGSMLGLSTDPGGMDDLMGGFKNPFDEKKKEEDPDGPLAFANLDPSKLPKLASASMSKTALSKESLFFRVHHRIGMRRERGDVR